jgi:hypothetical protein
LTRYLQEGYRRMEGLGNKGREHMKGLGRLHRVMGLSLVTAALVLLWAIPGTAGAAVQLGQTSPTNPLACGEPDFNSVQSAAVAANYQVPVPGGVITSWSHRGRTVDPPFPGPGSGRLQIWDSTGGNDFNLIGRSELQTFTAGVVTSFLTRIPVDPGDLLGLRAVEAGTGCGLFSVAGDVTAYEFNAPDPAPGDVRTLDPHPGVLLNVAAVLEADADGDGFGDETQDACLGEAGPNSGCLAPPANPPQPQPPPPQQPPAGPPTEPGSLVVTLDLNANKQKVKKKVKFSATATADSTLTAEGKKIKDTTKELAANQETTVKAKLKRKALNRIEDKGKGKVKITATATDQSGATDSDTVKVKLKD